MTKKKPAPKPQPKRCGICKECRVVEATKRIILSYSAPAGPGIGEGERRMWNQILADNPCRNPPAVVDSGERMDYEPNDVDYKE